MNETLRREIVAEVQRFSGVAIIEADEITTRDFAVQSGLRIPTAARRLKALVDEGRLTVRSVYDPRVQRVLNAYRIITDEGPMKGSGDVSE